MDHAEEITAETFAQDGMVDVLVLREAGAEHGHVVRPVAAFAPGQLVQDGVLQHAGPFVPSFGCRSGVAPAGSRGVAESNEPGAAFMRGLLTPL